MDLNAINCTNIVAILLIVQVLLISGLERHPKNHPTSDCAQGLSSNSDQICLPKCCKIAGNGKFIGKYSSGQNQMHSCSDQKSTNSELRPAYITPDQISSKTAPVHWFNYFPKCKEYVFFSEYRILENRQVVTQIADPNSKIFAPIWIDVSKSSYCIGCNDNDSTNCQSITMCKEDVDLQRHEIKILQRKFGDALLVEGGTTSGWLAFLSAVVLAITISVYIFLWKDQNIHGWTQVSFLVALFLMYFCAGLRRVIPFNTLQNEKTVSTMLEALEDFGCVAASANLVALSFDLFYTLWKSLPTNNKSIEWKRFTITTALAWSLGLVVMILSLFYRAAQSDNDQDDEIKIEHQIEYLTKILERFLCIQMFGMVPGYSLSILQLTLLFLNLLLFVGSLVILYRAQRRLAIAMENVNRTKLIKTWARRFTKLFLLMGLWWPMSVVCLAACVSIFIPTMANWKQALATFYLNPEPVHKEIPWYVHLVSNFLAVQAAIICSLLVIWNPKIVRSLSKRFPGIYSSTSG